MKRKTQTIIRQGSSFAVRPSPSCNPPLKNVILCKLITIHIAVLLNQYIEKETIEEEEKLGEKKFKKII